ncbi:MAG TPA: pitrilysin family protein [Myxococcota bacterium]|nr:pitrilysin family protein [Myxococcota bacterium]
MSNGLGVLLCPSDLAPVVELQVWAQVGSADEGPGEHGVAHFHEHMLFKGTARRGVGEVAGAIEGAGGRINAYTSHDVTVYHVTLPAEELAQGLDVLSDAVLHPVFDPVEIGREIEVVLEEIRRSEDSPGNVLGNALFAEAYRVHPYRAPILGTPGSVSAFERAGLRAFHARWYAPDNLVVVAVGAFEPKALLAQIEAAFGSATPRGARRDRRAEPAQRELRAHVLSRPFERASASLSWPAVGLAHADAPLLDLVAYVMGNGESSRLVRRVRERAELVERVDAGCYTPLDAGLWSIELETDAARIADAIGACALEVERLRSTPVSEAEIERARVNFLASEHFERESVWGVAAKLGSFHCTGGGFAEEQRYLEAVRRATPDDLMRVARAYLVPERLTAVALLPDAHARALDAAGIAKAVARGGESARRAGATPSRGGASSDIVSYTLDSGVRLHVLPRRNLPLVAARAALLGGQLAEDASTSGIGAFLTSLWLRGTENHSAAGFASAVESRAGEIDSFAGRSSFGLTLEAPSAQWDPLLDLFAEVLLAPSLDPEEIERERRETLAAIARREDQLTRRALLLFTETHFRQHPYRMPTLGTAASIGALDREALAAHHQALVTAHNLVVAVAGDVDPDAVARGISSRFADLDARPFERPRVAQEPAPREIRRAELRKDREQSHCVIGVRGVSVHDDDRYALEVVAQLLAGQGGRLFLELRDRRGLAYAVDAMSVEGLDPGWFAVQIGTAPERLDEARAGLLRELERLVEKEPPSDELERAKRHLGGSFAIDQQRNAVHAARIAHDSLYGHGPDAHRRYPARIAAVTPAEVLRVAQRIVKMDAYTEATIKPD